MSHYQWVFYTKPGAYQYPNSFCRDVFNRSDIHGLRIISEPVPKVCALYVHLAELFPPGSFRNKNRQESIFNITMTPIYALDLGHAGNITSPECMSGASEEDQQDEGRQEERC